MLYTFCHSSYLIFYHIINEIQRKHLPNQFPTSYKQQSKHLLPGTKGPTLNFNKLNTVPTFAFKLMHLLNIPAVYFPAI